MTRDFCQALGAEETGATPPGRMLLVLAALGSLAWLQPNHNLPWLAFHSDAWIAAVLSVVVAWPAFGLRSYRVGMCAPSLIAISVVAVCWIQYVFGMHYFAGDVWIGSAYAVGFLLAVLSGSLWQRWQPDRLGDLLFLAVGIAGVASVGLQLFQWLDLSAGGTRGSVWILPAPQRPFANLIQPNQLATLLVWAVLAALWGWLRGVIRGVIAAMMAVFLILGIALTQSRTALLEASMLLIVVWGWRYWRAWPSRWFAWVSSGLFGVLLVSGFVVQWLGELLHSGAASSVYTRAGDGVGIRPAMWSALIDAVSTRPWFGFGFNRIRAAQLETVVDHPDAWGVPTVSTHNLVLDLVVWFGIPIGVGVAIVCVLWFWKVLSSVQRAQDVVLVMVVLSVGIHAMLELPLHYAYFLLPVGMVIGMLQVQSRARIYVQLGKKTLLGLLVGGVTLFGFLTNDYLRLEADYLALRFEQRRIGLDHVPDYHRPVLLTQLGGLIAYARAHVGPDMDTATLTWMREVTTAYPSMRNILKLAHALGVNGRSDEAQDWLQHACPVAPLAECAAGEAYWHALQRDTPVLASIPWPARLSPE